MEFRIDNVDLAIGPSHVLEVPPEATVYPTSGANKVVVQPRTPAVLEVRWGLDVANVDILDELRAARGQRLSHVVSWRKEDDTLWRHANVFFPQLGYGQGPIVDFTDVFTLRLEMFYPMPGLLIATLRDKNTLVVGNGSIKYKMPAGGRILGVEGYLKTTGSVSGQTRIQLSVNSQTDYLATEGDFLFNGDGHMVNQVLIASPFFDRGTVFELDIDTIPGGADSANIKVRMWCLLFAI